MKLKKTNLKERIKKLLQVEDVEIIENAKHNEEVVKKELKKIVKANESLVQDKPIDTSILIKKMHEKKQAIEMKEEVKQEPEGEGIKATPRGGYAPREKNKKEINQSSRNIER